jgi:hypothetical protein
LSRVSSIEISSSLSPPLNIKPQWRGGQDTATRRARPGPWPSTFFSYYAGA